MKKFLAIMLLLIPAIVFAGGQQEASTATDNSAPVKAKYIMLFIGDGMAMPQINAAEAYLNALDGSAPGVKKLSFTQWPSQGLTTTYSANAFITDSAAAGTALATGSKTDSGVISMDSSKTKKLKTIAEMAKEEGLKVGIISSVDVDHATPAVFYAHNESRNNYYDIGLEMADSGFDYFGGGLIKTYKTPEGKPTVLDVMEEKGWVIAKTREELNALQPGQQAYAYYNTSFTTNSLDYGLDQEADDISLAEYTKKGIELLDNENGFFMMVEGGKIDWACHANDAASSISDTIEFDKAVKEGLAFYNQHPDETLIIVTGDHETGGLTLGFAGTKYGSAFAEIQNQKISYENFDKFIFKPYMEAHADGSAQLADLMPEIEKNFGLTDRSDYENEQLEASFQRALRGNVRKAENDQDYLLYGGYNPLSVTVTHLLNRRAGLAWTSYSHTGVPVQTFAIGAGQEMFNGYYDNTDIFKKMKSAMLGDGQVALAE